MASSNPISPKVIWAGVGSLIGPLLLTIGQAFIDIVSSGSVSLPEPWDKILYIAAALVGAVVASYAKTDPLRVPTVNQDAVNELQD